MRDAQTSMALPVGHLARLGVTMVSIHSIASDIAGLIGSLTCLQKSCMGFIHKEIVFSLYDVHTWFVYYERC